MQNEEKTTVVSFVLIKGGTGKSHISILLARFIAAARKRVLLIDFDLNNSLSYHFLDEETQEKTERLNIAAALSDEKNNLCDYAVPTITPGVDLIASTPYLSDLRAISGMRLKRMIPTLYGVYDICIIDCPPTYDNIVLNAINASSYIISPVLKDLFSYNASAFLCDVFLRDVEDTNKGWYLLINGYDKRFELSKSGRQIDFVKIYQKKGFPMLPKETWLPWTSQIHQLIDYHKVLTCTKGSPGAIYNPDLYKAITELADCFVDGLVVPEVF